MNPPDPIAPQPPLVCHDCGATISSINPLGGGLCEACLWRDLSSPPSGNASPYRDLVPGHEIVEELGRGGMGIVYRARQLAPVREVALKMLLPLDEHQDELKARFQQEARTLADLNHPAILPLYLVGEVEGRPYFTMKLAVGGTLAGRLSAGQPWPALRAAELTAVLAEALHYAHMRGVIHRDLKPGNVLFDEADRAYIADFGLAKLEDARGNFLHSAGVLGTPAYLAPEVAASGARAATTATDIYSLGAVLFELLTGHPPFGREGLAALLIKITAQPPPAPTSLNARVPRDLEIVCLKCLRKSPADRYGTAAELAEDLRRWIRGEPVQAREFTPVERLASWARRRPALAGLSAALIFTALGSAVWLTHSNRQLNRALARADHAQALAARRAEFYLSDIADKLEALGRLDIVDPAYEDVLKTETGADEASRRRRARLLTRWGRSQFLQMRHAAAAPALTEAVKLAESLPPTAENLETQAEASVEQATLVAETGSFDQAVVILHTAEERVENEHSLPAATRHRLLARLAEAYVQISLSTARALHGIEARPTSPAEASVQIGLSTVYSSSRLSDQAVQAVEHRRRAAELNPGHESRLLLAAALRLEGETLVHSARTVSSSDEARSLWKTAQARFEEASAIADDLASRPPATSAWLREKALNIGWLADTILALDPASHQQAEDLLKRQVDLLQQVVAMDSLNLRHRRELTSAFSDLADHFKDRGDEDREDAARRQQASHLDALHAQAPTARSSLFVAMNADLDLGRWHFSRGRLKETEIHFQRAWTTARQILVQRPHYNVDFEGVKDVSEVIRKTWEDNGHGDYARHFLESALRFTQEQTTVSPNKQAMCWLEAHFHRRLAGLAYRENGPRASLQYNLAALRLRADALRERSPSALKDPAAVSNGFRSTEINHLELGEVDEAVALAQQALDLRSEVADISLDPNPWADAIIVAAEKGVENGGQTAVNARRLAARTLAVLYPLSLPNTPPTFPVYQPKPSRADRHRTEAAGHIEKLKLLAGPEATQAP